MYTQSASTESTVMSDHMAYYQQYQEPTSTSTSDCSTVTSSTSNEQEPYAPVFMTLESSQMTRASTTEYSWVDNQEIVNYGASTSAVQEIPSQTSEISNSIDTNWQEVFSRIANNQHVKIEKIRVPKAARLCWSCYDHLQEDDANFCTICQIFDKYFPRQSDFPDGPLFDLKKAFLSNQKLFDVDYDSLVDKITVHIVKKFSVEILFNNLFVHLSDYAGQYFVMKIESFQTALRLRPSPLTNFLRKINDLLYMIQIHDGKRYRYYRQEFQQPQVVSSFLMDQQSCSVGSTVEVEAPQKYIMRFEIPEGNYCNCNECQNQNLNQNIENQSNL